MRYLITLTALWLSLWAVSQNIVRSEYWFNDNSENRVMSQLAASSDIIHDVELNVDSLHNGLNTLQFRFQDETGVWSSVLSRFFIKRSPENDSSDKTINAYEYWFDDSYEEAIMLNTTSSTLFLLDESVLLESLSSGLHTFHIRFQQTDGEWTSAMSRFFMLNKAVQSVANSDIFAYQYWYDSDYNAVIKTVISNSRLHIFNEQLNVEELPNGLHSVHFRSIAANGSISPVYSQFFIVANQVTMQNNHEITAVEYWFNNEPESKNRLSLTGSTMQFIDELNRPDLKRGLHTITYRFVDASGKYSSAVTRFVVKNESVELVDKEVVGYRYWLEPNAIFNNMLQENYANEEFSDSLNMRMFWAGEYMLHMQFKDSEGLWSSVISDTVTKHPFIYARLFAGKNTVCQGDTIVFNAEIVDVDSLSWNFGTGTIDTGLVTQKVFNDDGSIAVSAKAFNHALGDSVEVHLENPVTVHAPPEISLEDSLVITDRETHSLDVGEGYAAYHWNNEAGGQTYLVDGGETGAGMFPLSLRVENEYGCITSDTIIVRVKSTVDLQGTKTLNLKLYPNPFVEVIHIEWDKHGAENYSVIVVDATGVIVARRQGISSGESLVLDQLPSGPYIILVHNKSQFVRIPVIKQ